ncbi:MAG: mercury methylation ferredoxin HgcB [Candidatus Wallbacteria bacterium]|nr:mercury methylation ferredoxin HgcB [Candidatus Wallbacteria bacterium]
MLRYLSGVVTLKLDTDKCIGCGMCLNVCPHAVFSLDHGKAHITDKDACMECGACAKNCPAAAIKVNSGVGCATGLLYQALGVKSDCCCSGESGCCSESGEDHPAK